MGSSYWHGSRADYCHLYTGPARTALLGVTAGACLVQSIAWIFR